MKSYLYSVFLILFTLPTYAFTCRTNAPGYHVHSIHGTIDPVQETFKGGISHSELGEFCKLQDIKIQDCSHSLMCQQYEAEMRIHANCSFGYFTFYFKRPMVEKPDSFLVTQTAGSTVYLEDYFTCE